MKYIKFFESKLVNENLEELISSEKEEISSFLFDINSRIGKNIKLEILKTAGFLYCRIGGISDIIKVSPTNFDIMELSLEISELCERMSEIGYEMSNYHLDHLKVSMAGTGSLRLFLMFRKATILGSLIEEK